MTDNTQTPLERAARAAIEAECGMRGIDLGSPLWGKEIARAVLQAIREPSPLMIDKGGDLLSELDWNLHTDCQRAEQMFGSMIDAALGEG